MTPTDIPKGCYLQTRGGEGWLTRRKITYQQPLTNDSGALFNPLGGDAGAPTMIDKLVELAGPRQPGSIVTDCRRLDCQNPPLHCQGRPGVWRKNVFKASLSANQNQTL